MNMIKTKRFSLLILTTAVGFPCFAMQPLDDQSLSSTTGQDGISIGIGMDKIEFTQAAIIDQDGIKDPILGKNYSQAAGLVVAGPTGNPIQVQFLGHTPGSSTINAKIDTDGGNGTPFANIGITFAEQITGFKLSPFALYIASSNQVSSATQTKSIYNDLKQLVPGVAKILEIGSADRNFEITLNQSQRPQINVQLGNVPQGYMVQFGGAIQSICGTGSGCPIAFVSGNSSAKFDFQAKATDQNNGFSLSGFHAGVAPSGIYIGNTGQSSKMNVGLNNVMLGREGASSSTVFNGLANGSMGSFGAIGTSVKDLKVNINGL